MMLSAFFERKILVEEWISNIIKKKIYGKGDKIQQDIASSPLKNQEDSRYIEIADVLKKYESKQVKKAFLSSVYTTVEKSDNEVKSIKLWFDKEKDELKLIRNIEEEYDSSREMWTFYNKVYQSVFSTINEASMTTENYVRYYKELDEIKFGGEVDFNFSYKGKNNKIKYLETVVSKDEKIQNEQKKSIIKLIDNLKIRHHSEENVSIMPSNGNLQFTKQNIGNDRFDVMVYAIDEYCNGNTALLFAHCTADNQKILRDSIKKLCFDSERNLLCSGLYYKKIYHIEEEKLIENIIDSGKKAIDSAQRVLEYIMLAYRVWICRSNQYKDLDGYDCKRLNELEKEYRLVQNKYNELYNP